MNFENFGGIKKISEENSSTGKVDNGNEPFKLTVEEDKDPLEKDPMGQIFGNTKESSSASLEEAVEETVPSRDENINNVSATESFSLPVKEIQDGVETKEKQSSSVSSERGLTRGEVTQNEKEKKGKENCVLKYLEALDDVEKKDLHFINNNWR